ncbi:Alpha/Beta hydrolase protein [Schizophyllum amplum]|uniref:Carboxylic ester hydrolase n=1 Tax=Schizophyllum amplum TaxID=97359 RepID=A0A550CXW3_9AGAR|nr:Alpha/Beta hydrolase protein [Auriculariopsis ampla]
MLPNLKSQLAYLLPVFQPIIDISATARPSVTLGYATYEGTFDDASNITQFLGVRYAAPPTNDLRWRPPQPPLQVEGVQQATAQPPMCIQGGRGQAPFAPAFTTGLKTTDNATLLNACTLQGLCPPEESAPITADEDCLFLNVYTPGDVGVNSRAPKPVLVWIHGGGYISGSATGFTGSDVYDGKYPVRRSQGGLVVVIQYRVGAYGFLAGKDVHAAGAANAGLLDQQFALQWVQKHIHKFGGNPSDVTIWGESAGAGSVYQHILANGGKTTPPLFNTAIVSSNWLPPQSDVEAPIPEAIYDELVKQTGCASSQDSLACLRAVDSAVLRRVNADMSVSCFSGTYLFVPVVDHAFIQEAPSHALAQRRVNGAHVLSVTNANEGEMFVNTSAGDAFDTPFWLHNVFPSRITDDEVQQAIGLYSDLAPVDQAITMLADSVFVCPSYRLMRAIDKPFKAEFAIDPALHGYDLPYYFPDVSTLFAKSYNNSAFDGAFASAFTNFALAKDPNVKLVRDLTPTWVPWTEDAPVEMLFNRTEAMEPDVHAVKTNGRLMERCSFWDSIASSLGQ